MSQQGSEVTHPCGRKRAAGSDAKHAEVKVSSGAKKRKHVSFLSDTAPWNVDKCQIEPEAECLTRNPKKTERETGKRSVEIPQNETMSLIKIKK